MSKRKKQHRSVTGGAQQAQKAPPAAAIAEGNPAASDGANRSAAVTHRPSTRRKTGQQQQRNRVLAGFVGIVGAALLAFVALGSGGADLPTVPQARLDLDPVRGNPDAPVTIIEYAAFACPSCRAWHNAGVMENILEQYGDQVKFVFRDYPVISPTYDRMAAEVAQCALDQGQEHFWNLHDALYTIIRPGASRDEIIRIAGQLNIDTDALEACAEAGTHKDTVDYDFNRGRNLGLPGTPSWLVNGQRIFNASPQALQDAINQALASS